MHEQKIVLALLQRPLGEELPAGVRRRAVGERLVQLRPRPHGRALGHRIEVHRIEEDGLVVIAHENKAAAHDLIQTFARVRSVADHVAQAVDRLDRLTGDVRKHRVQRFEVAVDIADDGFHEETPRTGWDATAYILPVCSANLKESMPAYTDKPRRLLQLYRPERLAPATKLRFLLK